MENHHGHRPAPLFTPPPTRKGVWFPLALGFLLLLAVPGMVFLALSLLGKETAVNGWLQRTSQPHLSHPASRGGPASSCC